MKNLTQINVFASEGICKEEKEVEYVPAVKLKVNIKALIKKKGWKGRWSGNQEVKYVKFLQGNKDILEQKVSRRSERVYKAMGNYLKSRNADQCRSHHLKQLQHHHTVNSIVEYYELVVFKMMKTAREIRRAARPPRVNMKKTEEKVDSFYSLYLNNSRVRIIIDADRIASYLP